MDPIYNISGTLNIFSAMITPAVLIMVCGSLTLGISQRLNRVMERTRKLFEQQKAQIDAGELPSPDEYERALLFNMLHMQTKRVRYLQRSLTAIYFSLSLFVLTSIAIGVVEMGGFRNPWIPLIIGFFGACMLFYGTLLLIMETSIALISVRIEMDFIGKLIEPLQTIEPHNKRRIWQFWKVKKGHASKEKK